MNYSFKQLQAFRVLAEERHFTRAAERCHQTQPAFSALIRGLEDTLGTRLFDRTTRKVRLTEEGVLFHACAVRIIEDMQTMHDAIRARVALRRGKVSVAALPSLAAGWLPRHFARFHAAYPDIELHLSDALLEPCIAKLRAREVDIALAALGADMSGLSIEPLCQDSFYMVCRSDHPLADHKEIQLSDLAGQVMIHLGRGSSIRQSLNRRPELQFLQTLLEVDHLATVTGMVAAGMGISLVPGMTLYQFRHPSISVVPVARTEGLERALYIVRRKEEALSHAAQAFYDTLLQHHDNHSE